MKIYKQPLYYEIAFSFINPKKQIDLFEGLIKKYSKIKVNSFLDIGCGPSLQLRELAKRGYNTIGLDSNPQMLTCLKQRAKEERIKIETIKGDMVNFQLKKKVDFAFIMMGTINCIEDNKGFLAHLDSVANSLKKGGLYLIENFTLDWINKKLFKPTSWIMKKDGIKVKTTYGLKLKNVLTQTAIETIRLEIDDNGKKLTIEDSKDIKIIFPQEFLTLLKLNNKFDFIGWFERNKINKLTKAKIDNIVILRRR